MEIILGLVLIVLFFAILALYLWSIVWGIGDAQKRGQTGGFVIFLFWLFGPIAVFVWLLLRPPTTIVERPPEKYDNPDDAIAAASQLDSLGEWDAAIACYLDVATRWPEHHEYVNACIKKIREKQLMR